jgi:hypothetical protein
MKTILILTFTILIFSLFSFTKIQKDGVKKIGENLYELSFASKSLDEAKRHEFYQLISQHYDLTDLEAGKVDRIDVKMTAGKAGPNWFFDNRITPLFVSTKAINYNNTTSNYGENPFNNQELKNILEKYSN